MDIDRVRLPRIEVQILYIAKCLWNIARILRVDIEGNNFIEIYCPLHFYRANNNAGNSDGSKNVELLRNTGSRVILIYIFSFRLARAGPSRVLARLRATVSGNILESTLPSRNFETRGLSFRRPLIIIAKTGPVIFHRADSREGSNRVLSQSTTSSNNGAGLCYIGGNSVSYRGLLFPREKKISLCISHGWETFPFFVS